jgi:MFS family permease
MAHATPAITEIRRDDEALYCANHPNVETLLRCNRCGKPICLKCAQLTDVGYRCNECIRGVQATYFNATALDNPIALGVGFLVSAAAAPVVSLLLSSFFFWGLILALMIGGGAGGLLAQIIRAAVGRRRGRYLRYFALAGIVFGVLVGSVAGLLFVGIPPLNLPLVLFTFLAVTTAYQMLR